MFEPVTPLRIIGTIIGCLDIALVFMIWLNLLGDYD